ncbi:hypothetical protein [Mangrovihabitans endophyticus]|uniref:Uncharacterized protein n=1 Tax=Mangrovihabitans endophyticus TaxID=1751298 RepID=A0A8J3BUV6_9ACTN|nr:hypothetical protein [Mangrovihabitans endophyticus]GGK79949.1 hypothetical protein GCM10012284_12440 [Mangrovihabitans endophyticus]
MADTMRRHKVLRTAIRSERGVPYPYRLPLTEDHGLQVVAGGSPDPGHRLRELLAQPFDLAQDPPFRAHLVPTGPEKHLLALAPTTGRPTPSP